MNQAFIAAVLSAVETIIQDTPAAIALWDNAKAVLTQNTDPTPEQWQVLLSSMATAHAKVQAG